MKTSGKNRTVFKYLHLLAAVVLLLGLTTCSLFYPFQISLSIQGEGAVGVDPDNPDLRFASKAAVTLTPAPSEGWYLDHWEGSIGNLTESPLLLTMDGDKTITAVFKEVIPYTLNASWIASSSAARLTAVSEGSGDPLLPSNRYLTPPPPAVEETDRIIVRYKEGAVRSRSLSPQIAAFGREIRRTDRPGFSTTVIKIDRQKAADFGKSLREAKNEALAYYRGLPEVKFAEPDHKVWAFFPDDTYYSQQWNFQQLGMPSETVTGAGVVVAVIDTGVASGLLDFAGTSFTPGYNFVSDNTNTTDDEGHGSHVAGTIAQRTDNGLGCAGMAYGATIMPIKALDSAGSGYASDIVEAIEWAADNGAHIINLSLGSGDYSQAMEEACSYAFSKGVAIFAASGNDSDSNVSYPAAFDNYVLAIGATTQAKARAPFSNYGASLDIMAPGVAILQQSIPDMSGATPIAGPDEDFYSFQGTSMAAPHAAALGALLKGKYPALSPQGIYDAIRLSAEDLGTTGWDKYTGWGLINPLAALNLGGTLTEVEDETTGTLNPRNNRSDSFTITASLGSIVLTLSSPDPAVDLDLYLLDANGVLLASSTNDGPSETINYFTGSLSGTYTIRVKIY